MHDATTGERLGTPGDRRRLLLAGLVHLAGAAAFFLLTSSLARGLLLAAMPAVAAVVLLARGGGGPRTAAWRVLGLGQLGSTAGWLAWYVSPYGDTAAGDVLFLGGYALSAAALVTLTGLRRRVDVVVAIDAALLAVGLGVVAWVLLLSQTAAAPDVSTGDRLVSGAYPLLAVVLVAVSVRLVLASPGSARAQLLLAWAVVTGVGDTVYAMSRIDGSFALGSPVFLWWLLGYAALTLAGLLPQDPSPVLRRRRRGGRLVVVVAVVGLPALMLVRAVQGSGDDVPLIAAGTVVMTVLAVLRAVLQAGEGSARARNAVVRRAVVRSVAGFVGLALLPVAGLSWLAVTQARSTMQAEVRDRMTVTADLSAEHLAEHVAGVGELVESYAARRLLASALAAPDPDLAAVERHLVELEATHPAVFGTAVFDAAGTLLEARPLDLRDPSRSFGSSQDVRAALVAPSASVSDAYRLPLAAGRSSVVVAVSAPVRDELGQVVGLLTAGYRLDAVRSLANRHVDLHDVRLSVTDATGRPLAGIGVSAGSSDDPLLGAALGGRSGTVSDRHRGDRRIASYRDVPQLGWAVVAEIPERVALAGADRLAGRVATAAVLLCQLLLGGLVLAVRAEIRRRQAEEALAEREEHLRSVLEAAGDAFVAFDGTGRTTAWNARAADVFGHPAAAVLGRDVGDVLLPVEQRQAHRERLAAAGAATARSAQRTEVELEHADGHRFPAEVMLWRSDTAEGTTYNAFVRDLTQDKLQAATVAAAHQAALEASRLKSEFVANMSHEIRTPMNGVLGMTTLLASTELGPVQRDYVDTIGSCAESLLVIIDDILDFSKIEAGKLELEAVDFELRPLVEDVAGLLGTSAGLRGIEVVSWIDPAVPVFVNGDPHRLRQVLNNLVGNAVKYTERGEVVVHLEPAAQGRPLVRVSVRDTGIGITPEQHARLFDAFQQADASTTRRYGGTGLGLTISRRLVELMGGRLSAVSTPGVGSTFSFDVPLPAATSPVVDKPRRRSLDGVRVLVVDDNATNRTVLDQYLASWAAEPTCVADAASALAAMRSAVASRRPFDVLVLDMHMPGTDGVELARAIAADRALPPVPMAMLTSTDSRGDRAAAEDAGIGAYLTKPVRQAQLFDRLGELLGAGQEAPVPVPAQRTGDSGRGRRVLVAEDNLVNQQVVRLLLEQLGYAVDVVPDGREAVRRALTQPYDAVLMDCQMPELDGFAATRQIRAAGGAAGATPVIALTASALASDERACRAAGMDDFLSKPVRLDALAGTLSRWTGVPVGQRDEPAAAEPDDSVLDREGLAALLAFGPATRSVIDVYLATTPGQLDELADAVAAHDLDAVARLAHVVAGGSGCVGGHRLTAACRDVEAAARRGTAPGADDVLRLRALHAQVASELAALELPDGLEGVRGRPGG